jgi:hypothetical protein
MKWVSAVRGLGWSVLLAALVPFAGCSSSSSNSCSGYCTSLCDALAECEVAPKGCQEQCEAGIGRACDGASAPDRLTCAELEESIACADYCGTLCERAPDCGSFDAAACVRGCAESRPSICNAASVGARTCDQLKPEIRDYESRGNAGPNDDFVSGGFGARYGLCQTGEDCDAPLGCSAATNTCEACERDADCAREYQSFICSEARECVEVDCLSDADCFGLSRICDAKTHECVQCSTDADCEGNPVGSRCLPELQECGDCVTNADCPATSPRCHETIHFCTSCQADADCTGRETPYCGIGSCVECKKNEHCSDGKFCDIVTQRCLETLDE